MKHGTPGHPKVRELARELSITRRDAVGLLEMLIQYAAEYTPRGDVDKHGTGAVAAELDWPEREANRLFDGLISTGWIEVIEEDDKDPIYYIHDWHQHSEDWVDKRLGYKGLRYANGAATRNRAKSRETARSRGKSRPRARRGIGIGIGKGESEGEAQAGRFEMMSPKFRAFCELHPRGGMNMSESWEAWVRHGCEDIADTVLASVREHAELQEWKKDGGRYAGSAAKFLENHRWTDDLSSIEKTAPEDDPRTRRLTEADLQ